MGLSDERLLHPALPAATCALAVLTLVLCVSITLGTDTYIGGISYPFFSDTGRDRSHGQYYIFAVGLTLTGVLWAMTVAGMSKLGKRLTDNLGEGARGGCLLSSAAGFLWAAAPFLALVSIFDTVNFSALHNLSAYAFFGFALIGVILHTSGLHTLARRAAPGSAISHSAKAKLIIAGVMTVCVVIYLPVGLAVACSPKRLTVAKCQEEGMSASHCQDIRMDGSEAKTKLWCVELLCWRQGAARRVTHPAFCRDYSDCPGTTTMRSVFQLLSVLSVLGFIGSMALDFARKDELIATEAEEEEAVRNINV